MNTTMRLTMAAIVALFVGPGISGRLHADEQKNGQPNPAPTTVTPSDRQAHLGVIIEPMPPALADQLPQLNGRGVVIGFVAPDSPAQKAGLKGHDIVLSYDNKPINSPEQLVRLIQTDKPGRNVVLNVLTSGKEEKVTVTLGEQEVVQWIPRRLNRGWFRPRVVMTRPQEQESFWERFDSMSLTRLDDKRFKAEISFKDNAGKIERKTFEGTRDEIRGAIGKMNDIPPAERHHLLRALDERPHRIEFGVPDTY